MPSGDIYIVLNKAVTISTAITVIQIGTGSKGGASIVRASVTQSGSTTSAQTEIAFIRKSAGATVTAAIDIPGSTTSTLIRRDPNQSASNVTLSTSTTGITASGEGTNTETVLREGFNVLNGWVYLPVPEERIYIPASSWLGLTFPTAPPSQTWDIEVVYMDM